MTIKKIKETCLYVSDLDRAEQFYHQQLGLPVISHVKGRHVFFRAGTSVLLCFNPEKTKEDTHLPPHFGYGKLHLAFEVSQEEYTSWKERIIEKGIKIVHEQEWKEGLKSFYFHDPEGHVLEIVPEGIWE